MISRGVLCRVEYRLSSSRVFFVWSCATIIDGEASLSNSTRSNTIAKTLLGKVLSRPGCLSSLSLGKEVGRCFTSILANEARPSSCSCDPILALALTACSLECNESAVAAGARQHARGHRAKNTTVLWIVASLSRDSPEDREKWNERGRMRWGGIVEERKLRSDKLRQQHRIPISNKIGAIVLFAKRFSGDAS